MCLWLLLGCNSRAEKLRQAVWPAKLNISTDWPLTHPCPTSPSPGSSDVLMMGSGGRVCSIQQPGEVSLCQCALLPSTQSTALIPSLLPSWVGGRKQSLLWCRQMIHIYGKLIVKEIQTKMWMSNRPGLCSPSYIQGNAILQGACSLKAWGKSWGYNLLEGFTSSPSRKESITLSQPLTRFLIYKTFSGSECVL